jgi:diguanylate cyclase (GGDEF)-like protein
VARRAHLLLIALAVVTFVLLTQNVLNRKGLAMLREQAQLCASALAPAAHGDLSDAVAVLQARNERLLAVAILDSNGVVQAVYPDRPAHRAAILSGLSNCGRGVALSWPATGETLTASTQVVSLGGDSLPTDSQAALLFRVPVGSADWLPATALFTAVLFIVSFLNLRTLGRWFEGHVVEPLREMATLPHGDAPAGKGRDARSGVWHETAQIAERFHELLETLAESDARTRRMEREAQRQILQRERGFDLELRRAKDRARTDPLTGLRNRTFLEEQLEPIFDRHAGQVAELSAVMIDLDNFKVYNDTRGHQVGDALLRFVGALLRGAIRTEDHAVRYGGDEFLLLLPQTDSKQAAVIAERIVRLFQQYALRLDRKEGVSMSAGVAATREHGCRSGHELVSRADASLYAAKRGGKNAVAKAEPVPVA